MNRTEHQARPVVKQSKFYSVFSKDDRVLMQCFDTEEEAIEYITNRLHKYPAQEYLIAYSYKLVKLADQPVVVVSL